MEERLEELQAGRHHLSGFYVRRGYDKTVNGRARSEILLVSAALCWHARPQCPVGTWLGRQRSGAKGRHGATKRSAGDGRDWGAAAATAAPVLCRLRAPAGAALLLRVAAAAAAATSAAAPSS